MHPLSLISNGRTISLLLDPAKTYIFDLAGRPLVVTVDGRTYVRGLDGRIKEKTWRGGADHFDRFIRDLNESDIRHLLSQLTNDVEAAEHHVKTGKEFELQLLGEAAQKEFSTTDQIFSRLLYWSPDQLTQDTEEFHRIYQSINILPPDQYFCLPLQVVQGCPWNKCSFCHFYRGRRFRIRPLDEIMNHIDRVKSFFGKSLALRRSVFLCDANAFVMPTGEMLGVLSAVHQHFPEQAGPPGGISTFADVPSVLEKSEEELREIRDAGLHRLYLGMESGSDKIRSLIRKQGESDELVGAVGKLKSAGFSVGLIVLLGVGGEEFEKSHVRESVSAIRKMKLGPHDILYFSPFQDFSTTDYFRSPETAYLTPITKTRMQDQFHSMVDHLHYSVPSRRPLTALYDIREFIV